MAEKSNKCPYCDENLEQKNGLLYCPKQKIFIGKSDSLDKLKTLKSESEKKSSVKGKHIEGVDSSKPIPMTEATTPTSLSGFWRRFFSIFIDSIVLSILFGIGTNVFLTDISLGIIGADPLKAFLETPWQTLSLSLLINTIPFWILVIVYFSIFEGIWGATIGKFITGERVVNLKGGKAHFSKIFIRNIFKPLDSILGLLFFLFSSKNQIIGDKVAGTLVIQRNIFGASIKGEPVGFFRKAVGILIIASFIGMTAIFFNFWPIISGGFFDLRKIEKRANEIVQSMKEAKESGDLQNLYELHAQEFRDLTSIEDFGVMFNDSEIQFC